MEIIIQHVQLNIALFRVGIRNLKLALKLDIVNCQPPYGLHQTCNLALQIGIVNSLLLNSLLQTCDLALQTCDLMLHSP